MKTIILLIILCIATGINVLGQAKEITSDESMQQLIAAFKKFDDASWRKNNQQYFYKNGELSGSINTIDERIKVPDRFHQIVIETSGKITKKSETIRIGKVYYCRSNDGNWKKSNDWCDGNRLLTSAGDEEVSSKYTVEETKINNQKAKLYEQYTIYKRNSSSVGGKEELTFWQYKFWINEEGFILRREIESGLLEPKKLSYKMTEICELSPKNLKIEAPVLSKGKK